MKLTPKQPDIETIVRRIDDEHINLQPDFQRGEVWSEAKKQRLVDTILREWYVPPIHVIDIDDSGKSEVLDGQQRLVAIRDFVKGEYKVDGEVEPSDPRIQKLNGLKFAQLPDSVRRRFQQYSLTIYHISDFNPEEPGELFYRLNQPISLTAAEQRNAFYGAARQQVKDLVRYLQQHGVDKEYIGFTNSRMAYDDILARLCVALEEPSLKPKVTASKLASRYRDSEPFDSDVIYSIEKAILVFGGAKPFLQDPIRLNRATVFTWLLFIARLTSRPNIDLSAKSVGLFITEFEQWRINRAGMQTLADYQALDRYKVDEDFLNQLRYLYEDHSSSRVTDGYSVLTRDIVIWTKFYLSPLLIDLVGSRPLPQLEAIQNVLESHLDTNRLSATSYIDFLVSQYGWGELK